MATATAAKSATKVSRCRVCHRELRDAAAIAAGVGRICATKAARGGVRSVDTQTEPVAATSAAETAMLARASERAFSLFKADESQGTSAAPVARPTVRPAMRPAPATFLFKCGAE